jgi:hypothetical protein
LVYARSGSDDPPRRALFAPMLACGLAGVNVHAFKQEASHRKRNDGNRAELEKQYRADYRVASIAINAVALGLTAAFVGWTRPATACGWAAWERLGIPEASDDVQRPSNTGIPPCSLREMATSHRRGWKAGTLPSACSCHW